VYYVPNAKRDLVLKVARAMEKVSQFTYVDRKVAGVNIPIASLSRGGKICIEPRYNDDSAAMEILIDGVIRNTDTALDELSEALAPEAGKRQLGKRALASKREDLLSLEKQLSSWEKTCAVSLDLLQNRINEAKAAIGIAELAAEALAAQEESK
jgi:hypothetical protein